MADSRIGDETRARIAGAWPDILARIAAGELIKDILREHALSLAAVHVYMRACPTDVRTEWDDARERSADAFYDEALEVSRTPSKSQVDAADARTRIDTLKWAARIRNPRAYQDQSKITHDVRTVDLTAIIAAANARLAATRSERAIEGERLSNLIPAELDSLL